MIRIRGAVSRSTERVTSVMRRIADSDVGPAVVRTLDIVTPLVCVSLAWLESRQWHCVAKGVPAIAAAIVLVIALDASQRLGPPTLIADYRQAATAALRQGDVRAAELWLRKVVWIDESDPANQYALAMLVEQNGDNQRAIEIVRRIAPPDSAGYPEAHLWLARTIQNQGPAATAAQTELLIHHLTQALRSRPLQADAHAILGSLELQRGSLERAVQHFEQAASREESLSLTRAQLYSRLGRPSQLRRAAEQAAEYHRGLVARDPTSWRNHVNLAQSELLLNNFPAAIRILEAALPAVSDPKPVRIALSTAYLGELGKVAANNGRGTNVYLALLERSLHYAPDDPQGLAVLAGLVVPDPSGGGRLHAELQQALADGSVTAVAHLILGIRCCVEGDSELAEEHLAFAELEGIADAPTVMSHLARWLVQRDPDQRKLARRLVDNAARLSDAPEIVGIRSEILAIERAPADSQDL